VTLLPPVDHWDEETYRARQGDTFESVSKLKYGSEAYGQALRLFNRNHPQTGDGVRFDQPLPAGQPVYIPPAEVLRRRHGNVIPESAAPRADAGPVEGGTAAPALKAYRVGGGGESMWKVAERALGNGERWPEIYKLNPGYASERPIPAGTQLKLPADAVVPPENAP
jgi:phage tail protein X